MDDHDLCAKAMRKAGSGWGYLEGAEAGKESEFGETLEDAKLFDLAACPLAQSQLPIEIVWASLRASCKPSTTSGSRLQSDHDAMAERYTKLMKLPGMSTPSILSSR